MILHTQNYQLEKSREEISETDEVFKVFVSGVGS